MSYKTSRITNRTHSTQRGARRARLLTGALAIAALLAALIALWQTQARPLTDQPARCPAGGAPFGGACTPGAPGAPGDRHGTPV
ncbi:hypothetical protein VR41_00550 [Streptomyces sp. NRRL B-1568]|uniref:Uncharacterized protein n=1 Tax=Streptomyces olivoverticillatus TaxID=66427 RepID=A0A7W7LJL0_9ACTN|nr:hypothetical protein [Streptomyces olivoverticillatus]KJY44025.1 hypothetical protein VR41_00550 [Streptomyces sp. NRRL B-1568]MBB4891435.1 hypothetical protein [Streptomyces olivoverticillatus]